MFRVHAGAMEHAVPRQIASEPVIQACRSSPGPYQWQQSPMLLAAGSAQQAQVCMAESTADKWRPVLQALLHCSTAELAGIADAWSWQAWTTTSQLLCMPVYTSILGIDSDLTVTQAAA